MKRNEKFSKKHVKLTLSRESIRLLSDYNRQYVIGGVVFSPAPCNGNGGTGQRICGGD